MLDSSILLVRVLFCVLVGLIGGNAPRDVLRDEPVDAVGVGPLDVPDQVIESLQYVGTKG